MRIRLANVLCLYQKSETPTHKSVFYFLCFKKVGMLYQNLQWLSRSGVSCGWWRDVRCQRGAYAESALPGPMAGRPWAMAELTRRALRWHWTWRRHLQETDKPNQAFLLFWNGGSTCHVHAWPWFRYRVIHPRSIDSFNLVYIFRAGKTLALRKSLFAFRAQLVKKIWIFQSLVLSHIALLMGRRYQMTTDQFACQSGSWCIYITVL